jgi:hypothetical protein
MNQKPRTEIYKKAIEKWGQPLQIGMAIEEMAELIKELNKWMRGKKNDENIIEEMADVEIMLEQLKVMFSNHSEIEEAKHEKLKRVELMLHD